MSSAAPDTAAAASASETCSNATTLFRNDDGSSGQEPLGFSVNYFGQTYSSVYVNNNGNITFDTPLRDYVPFNLRNTSRRIVAPFFADVDTRPLNGGTVQYGPGTFEGRQSFCVTWNVVGYYSNGTDRLNTFTMWIVNRGDRRPGDFDIAFRYDQIQWELGSASGGVPARAGFSSGTGNPSQSVELAGSGVSGGFLDSNPNGLTRRRSNSAYPRTFVFRIESGAFCSSSTSCPTVTVHALEATQSLQDLRNSIPLVKDRSTVVRAYMSSDRARTRVSPLIRGFSGTTELANSPVGLFAGGAQVVSTTNPVGRRDLIGASHNFLIPKEWTQVSNLRLVLDVPGVRLRCDEYDTIKDCAVDLPLAQTRPLKIKTVRPRNGGDHSDVRQWLERAQRVQSIFPVGNLQWSDGGTIWVGGSCTYTGLGVCAEEFLSALQRKQAAECANPCDTFYVGLTDGSLPSKDGGNVRGMGYITPGPGLESQLLTSVSRIISSDLNSAEGGGRNVVPHEVGHNVGIDHAYPEGDTDGVGTCRESSDGEQRHPYYRTVNNQTVATMGPDGPVDSVVYGTDIRQLWRGVPDLLIASPNDTYALLSYCANYSTIPRSVHGRWAAINEYRQMLRRFAPGAVPVASRADAASAALPGGEGPGLLIGLAGDGSVSRLRPALLNPFAQEGDYAVVLTDGAGSELTRQRFGFVTASGDGDAVSHSASVSLAELGSSSLRSGTLTVEGPDGAELATVAISANPPSITGTATGAESGPTVSWVAEDLDGGDLTFDVAYLTADDEWSVIGSAMRETSLTVPWAGLSVGPTTRFRVTASDESHVSVTETNEIDTVPDAGTLLVNSPSDGATFSGDQPVVLDAVATRGGEDVTDEIEWRSDLDGALGGGGQLFLVARDLTVGRHTITASLAGGPAQSISVEVVAPIAPGPVENLTLTPTVTGLHVAWDPPTDPPVPTGYRVEITPGDITEELAGYQTSLDMELPAGTYSVAVTALANNLESDAITAMGTVTTGPTTPPQRTLTATVTGPGSVESSPAGILCLPTCVAPFDDGSQVTLTPTAEAGATFDGWTGACAGQTEACVITLDDDAEVGATFTGEAQSSTIGVITSGNGRVFSTPAGLVCPPTCVAPFAVGDSVTLVAEPDPGSTFVGWGGGTACDGPTGLTCTITAPAGVLSLTATFTSGEPPIGPEICHGPPPASAPPGWNLIVGTNGRDKLRGTKGRDLIFGLGGDDSIAGNGGDDILCGGDGNDRLSGNRGNDILVGGSGNDRLSGNGDNDMLYGGDGDDDLRGGSGNDFLDGGVGNDRVDGGKAQGDSCVIDPADRRRRRYCETEVT